MHGVIPWKEFGSRYSAGFAGDALWLIVVFCVAMLTAAALVLLRTQKPRRLVTWALLVPTAAFGLVWAWHLAWMGDDAFISFRYAENLARGHGLVFNPGERVEGYTNFLWTVLLAAGIRVGIQPIALSVVLSMASFVATMALATRLVERWSPTGPGNLIPISAVVVAANYTLASFATSGLETMLGAALVLACVELASSERPLAAGFAATFATMAHPDHGIFLLSMGIALATTRPGWKKLLRYAAPFALIYLPYFLWRWRYYGDLFPNTYYAKSADRAYFSQGWTYVVATVFSASLFGVVPLALAGAIVRFRQLGARFFLIAAPLFVAYVAKIGGDFMLGRLFVPLLPLLMVFAECSVRDLFARKNPWLTLVGAPALALVFLPAIPVTVFKPMEKFVWISDERTFYALKGLTEAGVTSHYAAEAKRLRELVVSRGVEPLIGAGNVGMYGWFSKVKIVDTLALTDRTVARMPIKKRMRPGHEKIGTGAYLLARQVDFAVDPIFPEPYNAQVLLKVAGVPYSMSHYQPDLFAKLAGAPKIEMVDVRPFIDGYTPTLVAPDRRECDVWFWDEYYFRHVDDPARRSTLISKLSALGGAFQGYPELSLRAPQGTSGFSELSRLRMSSDEGWSAAGEAFRVFPASGPSPDQQIVSGNEGTFANSMAPGELDQVTGTLSSRELVLAGDAMTLLVGGGQSLAELRVALVVDGQEVRVSTGCGSEALGRRTWDIRPFKGKRARIQIVDAHVGGWGHVLVDEIVEWKRQ
ncbi:MAG: hypothetical protein U0263_13475 [Polyangiaceae bacterium]